MAHVASMRSALRQCRLLLALSALVLASSWPSGARAQACAEALRTLQALQQQLRAEVLAGNITQALAVAARRRLEPPASYDFDNDPDCQKWALEVALAHRASCSFDQAREHLKSIQTEQPRAIDAIRSAQERLTRASSVPFTCKDKKSLFLVCEPSADTAAEAWCARAVEHDDRLQIPRSAWCKLVDEHGVEVSTVGDGYAPTCREDVLAEERAQRSRVRAERRASVATSGAGIAVLAAISIPLTFVPMGVAKLLRRLGALDEGSVERMRHRSFRARQRVLPLLGVTALSVAALSSRYWWAGLLTAGCGVTADVMLAQHWHHHDKTRRSIGIATATLGATAGLLLNLETLGWSEAGPRYTFLPTLRIGVAQAELGLAGRF
ncbi:MAG TPA: hypothetical protein VFX59_20965 [Polyangiales bacterium]|nr:hypothetical protein [Polyangiales bacterium]